MSRRTQQVEIHFQHGRKLHAAGRLAEAEQAYRQILAVAPAHADSLHMLGVLATQAGQPQGALGLLDRAVGLRPTQAIYRVNRAAALLALGEVQRAADECRAALHHKANCAEAFQVLGHALSDLGKPEEAIDAYRQALRHNPALRDLHNNLGLALRQAGRPEEAAAMLREAVARAPDDEQAASNLAGVLKELGHLDEAEALYRAALRDHPGDAMLHFNRAIVLLQAGRLAEGWQEYEWRFATGILPEPPAPRWQGEALAGRALLVHTEQGLGDTIQFCRYLPLISGGPVILHAPPPLRRLLAGLDGAERISLAERPDTAADLHIPLLSLPRLFDAPAPAPYLAADAALTAAWRDRLGTAGYRIGIAWQGNPTGEAEFGRSVPLRHFAAVAAIPGVRLISLQKHDGLDQLAEAGFAVETPALDAGPDAFVDTAALMQSLDLIITSDTAVAHLAGALGRPVWVALQHVPDWRWMLDRPDTPWYPTMRLFRQARRGDWGAVFAEIARDVAGIMR